MPPKPHPFTFEPLPEEIQIDDPLFVQYKTKLGIQPIGLKCAEKSVPAADHIINTANELAAPFQGTLHNGTEFAALYEITLGYHDNIPQPYNAHILNSGTFRASNACLLATALRDSSIKTPLITIDPFTYAHTKTNLDDNTDLVLLHHKQLIDRLQLTKFIVSVIHTDLEFIIPFWNQNIRIAVVDTYKSYEHLNNQIQTIIPHIPPGGWFVSHDYMPPYNTVLQSLHEFMQSTPRSFNAFYAWAYLFIQFLT